MKESEYEIKKIYYLLLGIKESINGSIPEKVVRQYNDYIAELEEILGENLDSYKIIIYDFQEGYIGCYEIMFQINQILKYLENMHINSSEYQISKVGYLYNSIEDKELHDRCGDILLGETAFDRAINQATQILEDRIKNKAGLEKTVLIGLPLVSKAIHAKIENTILKFSDDPTIQEGYSFLFKGIISVYRNQTHHSLNFKCNRECALKFCSYIDELLKDIERSIVVNE
mgnify:FL=1